MVSPIGSARISKGEARAVRRFFTPLPRWTILLGVASGIAVIVGVADPFDSSDGSTSPAPFIGVAGFVGLALVVLRLAVWLSRPSEQQMDAWLARDLTWLQQRAIERCGLTGQEHELTSKNVVLTGPRFDVAGADFGYRSRRNGITRFSPVSVTILNFTEHELFAYQCALDRFTGNPMFETTDEYFYRDVVSAATETITQSIDKHNLSRGARKLLQPQIRARKLQIPSAEVFRLTTTGGTKTQIVVEVLLDRIDDLVMGPGGGVQVDDAERAMAGMRKMLREKKMGRAQPDPGADLDDIV